MKKEAERKKREIEILEAISLGKTQREIGRRHGISQGRVFAIKCKLIMRLRKGESIGGYTLHDFPGEG